jgi:hypothetical protein
MLRCYDCARLIPEGEAHRRTVKVGYSTGTSYRQPTRVGDSGSTETYSTSHYAQVTLCTECLTSRRLRFFWQCFSIVVIVIVLAVIGICGHVSQDQGREWAQAQQAAAIPPAIEEVTPKKDPPPGKAEPLEQAEPPAEEDGATKAAMPPAMVKNESGYRLGWNTTRGSVRVWNLSDLGTAKIWPGTKSTAYFHLPSGKVIPAELASGGHYVITKEGEGIKVTKLP